MKITLVVLAKTDEAYLNNGIEQFIKRLKHYVNFTLVEIPAIKHGNKLDASQIKEKEAELLIKYFDTQTEVVLLDEHGKQYTSVQFAEFLQARMNRSVKHLVFMVGGPFGFADSIKQKAHSMLSLSSMTFSHQMIRLFFVEQLYRAYTIIKGEKYHNE